ncbi:MAG: DUF692 domain-containing protein [Gammaproteobacteria bacterium]|nr:DUF692 domain-containing protein [Gammaproteobacteria bacterium]
MNTMSYPVHGAGLGLKRSFIGALVDQPSDTIDFLEVAPENWIGVGGEYGHQFRQLTERYPFLCHGLSLSIGSPSPLDEAFLHKLKRFLNEHNIRCYSEHLSYCSDDGHLYDLMPIPFTEEAIKYVSERIRRVQDILERPIAMENVSYYAAPGKQIEEIEFINAILDEADCRLLLDVNNVYVNSINHGYDAKQYISSLPAERIDYLHIAGHYNEADDLIVDTHGADVIDPVWSLLDFTYQQFGTIPTLLERDFNIPPMQKLLTELNIIHQYQDNYTTNGIAENRSV